MPANAMWINRRNLEFERKIDSMMEFETEPEEIHV